MNIDKNMIINSARSRQIDLLICGRYWKIDPFVFLILLQTPEQPTNGIDDAGNGTFVCSFENAIYDGGLGGGEIVSSRANDLDDSETDGDNAKQAKGTAYNNPAFAQISSE